MAAFSDPEVMAALQDGTFLLSYSFIFTMITSHFQDSLAIELRYLLIIWLF